MKALIRDDEVWSEDNWTQWTRDHIDWLTTARPEGDGYRLVNDYTEESEVIVEDPEPIPQEEVTEDDDYVVIGGVRYSKEELRSLIE